MSDFVGYLLELLLQKRFIRRAVILVLVVGAFYNFGTTTAQGWIAIAILVAFGVIYEIADAVVSRRRIKRQGEA